LYRSSLLRFLLACPAIVAAAALVGCDNKTPSISGRHMQPLSQAMLAELDSKSMTKESPILIRIFKEESELELWKVDKSRRFALLRTYPICRWSGNLGPKFQEGDRQAPEGFYSITPNLMNPYSNYHLAMNTGFPNAYDRANGRSGNLLMIHGDCASVGCYAMTDEQITEIYSLAREAFFGGQRSFQVQAYPFRMTPLNMVRYRDSPYLSFWQVLKQGYDHFEVTRKEPRIAVCDMHYVFDAQSSGKFNPVHRCPAYKVPPQIASAVHEKQELDEIETVRLINSGGTAPPATNAGEGGMHPTFLSALRAHGGPGTEIITASGTIPAHVRPPADPSAAVVFVIPFPEPKTVRVRVASAAPNSIGTFFGPLFDSKRNNPTADMLDGPLTLFAQIEYQEASAAPSAARAQTRVVATTQEIPVAQRTRVPPPDGGDARTSNLLVGALPILPAGIFF
jgi:murein L,D-transpeptidase YafK